jgi:hypothetical protein
LKVLEGGLGGTSFKKFLPAASPETAISTPNFSVKISQFLFTNPVKYVIISINWAGICRLPATQQGDTAL